MEKRALGVLAAIVVLACARKAFAEIPIASANGWDVSIDGRFNTFISFATGDPQPAGTEIWQGLYDYADSNGKITMTRIRTGFLQNVFGFTLKKKLGTDTLLTGRFAQWVGVSQERTKIDYPTVDVREVYLRVEGPWGGVLAGRNLSLFSRGAIQLDYNIEHAYGLGSPCAIRSVQGGACGHAGFGILFPGYNAGIVYNTPQAAGFQVSVGIFDPSAVSERSYERTPYPRVEGELTFAAARYFNASVSGQWQRIGQNTTPYLNVDATGVAFSAGGTLGPVQLGVAGFYGQGDGIYAAMENYPLFADNSGVLRHQQGLLGLGAVNFGGTKIAGGIGATQILKTPNDPPGPFTAGNYPKQQFGISAGVYQHIGDSLVLALEYFRAEYTWYDQFDPSDPTMMRVVTPDQIVHIVNAGVTAVFWLAAPFFWASTSARAASRPPCSMTGGGSKGPRPPLTLCRPPTRAGPNSGRRIGGGRPALPSGPCFARRE